MNPTPLLEALVAHGGVRRAPDDDDIELFCFMGDDDDATSFSEWCEPKTNEQQKALYAGDRVVLDFQHCRMDGPECPGPTHAVS